MKKTTKKSDKDKLAAGAVKIRKAEKEAKNGKTKKVVAPKPELVTIPESTRPIQEILNDRVKILDGHIGLELGEDTPIEENLRILDWATHMSDHVGFMIGDVLNAGDVAYGEKYNVALHQTGRAKSTLKNYAWVAKNTPIQERIASLSWTHHFVVVRLTDKTKRKELLQDAARKKEKTGEATPVRELRAKALQIEPRKKKDPKRVTSGKGKRKAKPEPPPYQPTPEEQAKLDEFEDLLGQANAIIKSGIRELLGKLDTEEKRRWLDKVFAPLVTLYNFMDKYTGY
jgi:hypothetical protein